MAHLDDMALFAAVVRAGSFTAAARALDLPLSTVSRRIAELEKSLSTKLIERTTRSLKVTDAGQVYFQHCSQLVEQAEEAGRALQRLKHEPSGHLRVALPFSIDDSWAAALLSGFLVKYPKITVELMLRPDGIDPDDESMDVLFASGERPQTHHPVARLGGTSRVALFASPRYLQRAGTPRTPADLELHDMIRILALDWSRDAPEALRSLRPKYRVTTNDVVMARQACLDDLGIGWLPLINCVRHVHQGALVPVMPEHFIELPVWIVYRAASRSTPKVALFVEHLSTLLGTPHVWAALEQGRSWRPQGNELP